MDPWFKTLVLVDWFYMNRIKPLLNKYCNHKLTNPLTHAAVYISAIVHLLSESVLNIVEPLTSPPLHPEPHAFPPKWDSDESKGFLLSCFYELGLNTQWLYSPRTAFLPACSIVLKETRATKRSYTLTQPLVLAIQCSRTQLSHSTLYGSEGWGVTGGSLTLSGPLWSSEWRVFGRNWEGWQKRLTIFSDGEGASSHVTDSWGDPFLGRFANSVARRGLVALWRAGVCAECLSKDQWYLA